MFLTIIIFIPSARVPFAKITTSHGADERRKVDFMDTFSAPHRYNCILYSDINPPKMKSRVVFFDAFRVLKMQLCTTER